MKITVIANNGMIMSEVETIYENKEKSEVYAGGIYVDEYSNVLVYKGKNTVRVMELARNLIINADYLGRDNVLINLYNFDNREGI